MDPCGRVDLYTNTGFDNRSDGQVLYKKKKSKRHGNKFETLTQRSLLNSVEKTLKIPVAVAQRHLWYFNDI